MQTQYLIIYLMCEPSLIFAITPPLCSTPLLIPYNNGSRDRS